MVNVFLFLFLFLHRRVGRVSHHHHILRKCSINF
jgi:hypothetical protein